MLEKLSPESFDIVNSYLTLGSAPEVSKELRIPLERVMQVLDRPDAKRYLDRVYLEEGYRNRAKLGKLLDKIIDKKLEDAEETEMYSSKDLADLIALAHKMRMEEMKASKDNNDSIEIKAGGAYTKLMERLLTGEDNDG